MNSPKHPMQPIVLDEHNVVRFKGNKIVEFILENAEKCVSSNPYHRGKLDLSFIASMKFPQEDVEQFWQLLGYSVSGYGELSFISPATVNTADAIAAELREMR